MAGDQIARHEGRAIGPDDVGAARIKHGDAGVGHGDLHREHLAVEKGGVVGKPVRHGQDVRRRRRVDAIVQRRALRVHQLEMRPELHEDRHRAGDHVANGQRRRAGPRDRRAVQRRRRGRRCVRDLDDVERAIARVHDRRRPGRDGQRVGGARRVDAVMHEARGARLHHLPRGTREGERGQRRGRQVARLQGRALAPVQRIDRPAIDLKRWRRGRIGGGAGHHDDAQPGDEFRRRRRQGDGQGVWRAAGGGEVRPLALNEMLDGRQRHAAGVGFGDDGRARAGRAVATRDAANFIEQAVEKLGGVFRAIVGRRARTVLEPRVERAENTVLGRAGGDGAIRVGGAEYVKAHGALA